MFRPSVLVLTLAVFTTGKTLLDAGGAKRDATKSDLPSFKWDGTQMSDGGVPYLVITFPDGGPDDIALLEDSDILDLEEGSESNMLEDDPCLFSGRLQKEPDVYVALNGCPLSENFVISFNTHRLTHFQFTVTDGVVQADLDTPQTLVRRSDSEPVSPVFPDDQQPDPSIANEIETFMNSTSDRRRGVDRSATYIMRISTNYDRTYYSRWGTNSISQMRKVVNLARPFFQWTSLTTKFKLQIVHERYVNINVRADGSIMNYLRSYNQNHPANADMYVYFGYDTSGGAGGMGTFHGVCNSNKGQRVLIVESFTDSYMGYLLAHEIGHNLYMPHDFDGNGFTGSKTPKYSSTTGRLCTNVGGVMDYQSSGWSQWTDCSVEWMNAYHDWVVSNQGKYCMAKDTTTTCTDISQWCSYYLNNGYSCSHWWFPINCKRTCNAC